MKRLHCLVLVLTLLFVSCTTKPEAEMLTLDDVITLSEKGLSLSWEDFENFVHEDVGSGRYIWKFSIVEPEYTLSVEGNSLDEPPEHILLFNEAGDNIEIRVDSIELFLSGESNEEPSAEPEPNPEPENPEPEPDKPAPPVSSAPSGGTASSKGQSQPAQPTYRVEVSPASYDVSTADSITVKITNTSNVEGGYGYAYRIEQTVNGRWETVPLEFDVMEIAAILPAGKTNTETFSLHHEQYDYTPGTYRIVFLDGLGGASAEYTITGSAKTAYSVAAEPRSYSITADSITVKIINTSQVEGGYGYAYRIEQKVNGKWEAVPLEFDVMEIAAILPAGKTSTETFSLHQEQYDYAPGTYRIVFLDGLGGATAEFSMG